MHQAAEQAVSDGSINNRFAYAEAFAMRLSRGEKGKTMTFVMNRS
jgi:hypothetical protein